MYYIDLKKLVGPRLLFESELDVHVPARIFFTILYLKMQILFVETNFFAFNSKLLQKRVSFMPNNEGGIQVAVAS